jgi:hypothetical protein
MNKKVQRSMFKSSTEEGCEPEEEGARREEEPEKVAGKIKKFLA